MNSIIIKLVIELIVFVASIIVAIVEHKQKNTKERILFWSAITLACAALGIFFFSNEVSAPHIDRESDYSAVTLSTDGTMKIEYRISTSGDSSDEWIEYEKPFKLEKSAIVYARASTLWYTSEQSYRNVYVAENGLVYFGGAEKPGDTIVSIDAVYNYKEPDKENAGNHYIGYEIKKNDFKVIGIDLNGDEKEITDFSYSLNILKAGKNDIEVEYFITENISVNTHVYVNGDSPALLNLDVRHDGSKVYLDTVLENEDFIVKGKYEDGTEKNISDFEIVADALVEGKNEIAVTKNGISDVIELMVIDREKITENESEPNDEIKTSDDIDVNIKYSGVLKDEDDIDYYRLRLDKKGKITIRLTHPKIDKSEEFWLVYLLDQQEDVRTKLEASGKNTETSSSAARVTPGIYYIKVSSYYYSDEKYTITILFEEEDDSYEDEPNDDLNSEAMVIGLDKEYTGNLTTKEDIDYFTFSISDKKKVWIEFSHNKTSTSDTLWNVALFGDSDGELLRFDINGENANILSESVRLPAGNYYLRIQSYYWSDLDYTFCIHSQSEGSETENECNDDYDVATDIAVGSTVIGNIQSDNDMDFYKFELLNASSVKVIFTHNRSDSGDIYWLFKLYSKNSGDALENSEEDTTIEIRGDSPEDVMSKWNSLPAGTYYLKVYRYSYNNSDYKIQLSN